MNFPHGTNPYRSPVETTSASPNKCQPMYFAGTMTEDEGGKVRDLLRGRRTHNFSPQKFVWTAVLSLLVLGSIAVESIFSDDLEGLLNVALGTLVVVGTLGVAGLHHAKNRSSLTKLRSEGKGVFTNLAGRIQKHGIEYLIGDYPIRYRWDDFAGYRSDDTTLVMYLDYPNEVNFLSASLFDDATDWQDTKRVIESNLPSLKRFPTRNARPKNPVMTHVATGINALNEQDWPKALAEFDQALLLRPGDTQALQGRMVSAVGIGDVEMALGAIENVVALGEPEATTRRLRASTLIVAERYDEALRDLDWLTERTEQEDSDLLRDRGLALLKLGRIDESLESTTAAIILNPKDSVAFNNRGATLLQLERYEEAIADLKEAIRLEPSFERPHELLAEASIRIAYTAL